MFRLTLKYDLSALRKNMKRSIREYMRFLFQDRKPDDYSRSLPRYLDLLPLYEEELLQLETKQFIEEHLNSCQECRHIAGAITNSQIPLPAEVKPGGTSKKMIRNITVKVTTIPIFFVAIAFILA